MRLQDVDFKNAEAFLKEAKAAHSKGDEVGCYAAAKMVGIALRVFDAPPRLSAVEEK